MKTGYSRCVRRDCIGVAVTVHHLKWLKNKVSAVGGTVHLVSPFQSVARNGTNSSLCHTEAAFFLFLTDKRSCHEKIHTTTKFHCDLNMYSVPLRCVPVAVQKFTCFIFMLYHVLS